MKLKIGHYLLLILSLITIVSPSRKTIKPITSSSGGDPLLRNRRHVILNLGRTSESSRSYSLWNGRIVVRVPSKEDKIINKKKKKSDVKLCITPTNQIGHCTPINMCSSFSLANIQIQSFCQLEFFAIGVCCRDKAFKPYPTITSTTTEKPKETKPFNEKDSTNLNTQSNSTINKDYDCGLPTLPSFRVVGGDVAPRGQWPWMAAIFLQGQKEPLLRCGGSLVSSQHILTGAHCMKDVLGQTYTPRQFLVRMGDDDMSSIDDSFENQGRTFTVQSIRVHPGFQNINQYFLNDVAVMKLSKSVQFSDFILPICLPTTTMIQHSIDHLQGKVSTVTGYGRTQSGLPSYILKQATVPVWRNSDCDDAYFPPITDKFICAGHRLGGEDACQGDSGGPLNWQGEGDRWFQIGITSFGVGCGQPNFPGVYTRVTKFMPWIRQNML